jgi:hypothetical protein
MTVEIQVLSGDRHTNVRLTRSTLSPIMQIIIYVVSVSTNDLQCLV